MKKLFLILIAAVGLLFAACDAGEEKAIDNNQIEIPLDTGDPNIQILKSEPISIGNLSPNSNLFEIVWDYSILIHAKGEFICSFSYWACDSNTGTYSEHVVTKTITADDNGNILFDAMISDFQADDYSEYYTNREKLLERVYANMKPRNIGWIDPYADPNYQP